MNESKYTAKEGLEWFKWNIQIAWKGLIKALTSIQ